MLSWSSFEHFQLQPLRLIGFQKWLSSSQLCFVRRQHSSWLQCLSLNHIQITFCLLWSWFFTFLFCNISFGNWTSHDDCLLPSSECKSLHRIKERNEEFLWMKFQTRLENFLFHSEMNQTSSNGFFNTWSSPLLNPVAWVWDWSPLRLIVKAAPLISFPFFSDNL